MNSIDKINTAAGLSDTIPSGLPLGLVISSFQDGVQREMSKLDWQAGMPALHNGLPK